MVRVISQETYDEVVKENMNDFEMSPQDAIEDAIKQFEAQGVNLSNIIKDLVLMDKPDDHILLVSIKELKQFLDDSSSVDVLNSLKNLKKECGKNIAHQLLAGKNGAYEILLKILDSNDLSSDIKIQALCAIIALMTGQPDLLDSTGINIMIKYLDQETDDVVIVNTLKWISICCLKHELNRQNIFDAHILAHLKKMLQSHKNPIILTELCSVIRHLVLDDDIRVEYGKAHEHARLIAIETLDTLTTILSDFKSNENFVSDILLTIATLVVRHEFCQKVEEAGGLKFILDVMVEFHEVEKLNRQCFKLLKALAGNDDVKRNIIKQGAAPLIAAALDKHKDVEPLASSGLGCIAALALREVKNSNELFEAGIPEVIIQCMNIHKLSLNVQRNASWAIRNMVARCHNQKKKFLEFGAEDLLNVALKNFEKNCSHDIKSALRDLGCVVKLDEQWTGKGGMIHTSSKITEDE